MSDRVLIVGPGGREHALAWACAKSPLVDDVVCAPGNPGMGAIGECIPVTTTDPDAVAQLADKVDADLVIVGPEDPLAAGVVDAVQATGRLAFGPDAAAARLEASKVWMKDVLVAAGLPTARHASFTTGDEEQAFGFLETLPGLYVIKTDGLASGKGVVVTESIDDARDAVRSYLSGEAFGAVGATCVIEEGLTGPELSLFALCDGQRGVLCATAQDHKRAFDNDQGANTGGMGAYSPVPFVSAAEVDELMDRAIQPTLTEMAFRGAPFRGVLYCGLMLTPDGPKVLEFNVRWGDPETQVLMPRFTSDVYVHMRECAQGKLETPVTLSNDAAVGVCLASEGYPPAPLRKGTDVVTGLDAAAATGALVFHAGTSTDAAGNVVTNGGRVLAVVGVGSDVRAARDQAYAGAAEISWPGVHYRRDIATQALQ
jgi:phosphoribosylamine---glycine ligase